MGKPGAGESGRYECLARKGVTVWLSPAVSPAPGAGGLVIDVSRILWVKRLVLKGARAT
jgi:hypothetical protein